MKILIAAASYASNISGIQRHACNVVRCLLQQQDVSLVHLVIAPWQRKLVQAAGVEPDVRLSTHIAEMVPSSLSRNFWHYRRLPELAAQLNVDLVHLTYPVPVNAAAFSCPTVVTLHDMYPYEIPKNFGFPKFIFNRLILKQCLRNVDAIACVSDITRLRLEQYSSAAVWQKGIRIYNCVEAQPVCAAQSPIPNWQGEPFLALCGAASPQQESYPPNPDFRSITALRSDCFDYEACHSWNHCAGHPKYLQAGVNSEPRREHLLS